MKLTARHEKAAFNLSVGLYVSQRMLSSLESHGLAYRLKPEWMLTERGCNLAAGRCTIKRGQIVRVKR